MCSTVMPQKLKVIPLVDAARRGASQSSVGFREQLRSYYSHHWLTFTESWRRVWSTPLSTLLTWLLVGVALSLPSGLYVLLSNAESLREDWQGTAQISLYLSSSASIDDGKALTAELSGRNGVQLARYLSSEQALQEFEQRSGMLGITESFDENPIPASIAVILAQTDQLPARSQQLLQELSELELVDEAQLDQQWLERLYQLMQLLERLAWALAILLSVAIVLIIGNTIRLSIENRRAEILIVKLTGGTNAYVQRPFIYYGLLFGLGGGLSCMLILAAVYVWIQPPLQALSAAYGGDFGLQGPGLLDAILLILVSSTLGVAGAWLAVYRHLRGIEPE